MAGKKESSIKDYIDRRWDNEQHDPSSNERITDTKENVSSVLDILEGLDKNNCCDRLFTLFDLFHKAWIKKRWIDFYKVLEDWEEQQLFQTEAIIVPEEIFNEWKLEPKYITVNPSSGGHYRHSLELPDIDDTEDNDSRKNRIIRFIQEHAKYLN